MTKDLNLKIINCSKCKELCKNRTTIVSGIGPYDAKIMIVGEAPGETEDLSGEPFVGRAGKLLDKILESAGIKREQVYITNTVKCRPPKNRTPEPQEIDNCGVYLWMEIRNIKPRLIITLGKTPLLKLVTLKKSTKLADFLGREIPKEWPGIETTILPCLHPSYLLQYGRDKLDMTIEHFKLANKYL